MRSHLTRHVFNRLLTNEAFLFRCPHQSRPTLRRRNEASRIFRSPARRTLFGFSQKAPKQIRESNIAPGLVTMRDLGVMGKVRARPPAADELIKAFNTFCEYKIKNKESVEEVGAQHLLRTFRHLKDTNSDEEGFGLSISNLRVARDAMMIVPASGTGSHNEFAREVFAELQRRKPEGLRNLENVSSANEAEASLKDFTRFLAVLSLTGDTLHAKELFENFWPKIGATETKAIGQHRQFRAKNAQWNILLKGFAREQNEVELVNTANMAEDIGIKYDRSAHATMTTFFASSNDIENTKAWYIKPMKQERRPSSVAVSEVLQFCLRNNETDWCKSIFRELIDSKPDKPTWDIIFQWAAGGLGKGVEDVERMMEVMVQHNSDNPSIRPDSDTINGLVNVAMSKNDPYLAERYLALGLKSGIRPNAKTFILQMDYRIDAGDLSGAQVAYESLQSEEVLNREDLPVINKYLRALCSADPTPYDKIASIASDLDERKALLEADTVAALCLVNLRRNDYDETLNTLQAQSFHLGFQDRARIRDTFLAFCLDRSNSNMRAWDAYTLLKSAFSETDISIRTKLMNEFFDRKRSDMGFHVFGHMRQDIRPEMRPTIDTYVQCFEGIAKCADMESLDMVHNMMKMDSSIEPSTRLYNSLMLAYAACDEADRALDFWTDITNSREGPTYNSIEIVFRACETKPFGDKPAKQIWNKMRRMEIEVTPAVFNAYVGALAGQALLDEVKVLIESMKTDFGYGPDMMTIGIFYNAAPGQNHRDEIEEWARARYPELWEELETTVGQRTTEFGDILINIVRDMKA